MPRRLLVLNVVLGLVSLAFAVGIVRTLLLKHPLPAPMPMRAAAAAPPAASTAPTELRPEVYAAIAAENPFNPGRSETASAAAIMAVVKPILHGIVIHGATSRAFLEDPAVKRVSGYSVGDMVGGGKIQKIADDRVVIARPEGMVEVLLQDPSKPRPVTAAGAVPVVTAAPGQPAPGLAATAQPAPAAGQAGAGVPGQLVPPPPPPPPQVVPTPAPGAAPGQPPTIPSQLRRRPVPGQPNE